ncbi:MAG: metal-dependent hydrolase, partial [Terriglobia bacterium]
MDPVTTGLGGALIGRALPRSKAGPAATLTLTLASIVPDVDIFFQLFDSDPMAGFTSHRALTHSLLGVPLQAPLVALLVWLVGKDRNYPRLLGLAALGVVFHLFTDLITSWGTIIYHPFDRARVAWDLIFIIDFIFTATLLLPHLLAWVYKRPQKALLRAGLIWAALTAVTALAIAAVALFLGRPFNGELLALLSAALALLFAGPAWRRWGFRQGGAFYARAGLAVFAAYMLVAFVSHELALGEVKQFARARGLRVEAQGALPLPLSPFRWSGLILTPDGVYQGFLNVLEGGEPQFALEPSDDNPYVAEALRLPATQTYLWFARFPVVRYREERLRAGPAGGPGRHVVEITDRR